MNLLIIVTGLLIFHFAAINGMSLITGKAKIKGFLEDNSFLWSISHIIGISCLIISATSIYLGGKYGVMEIGVIIAILFYFIDLAFIGRFFLYNKK